MSEIEKVIQSKIKDSLEDKDDFLKILKLTKIGTNIFNVGSLLNLKTEFFKVLNDETK